MSVSFDTLSLKELAEIEARIADAKVKAKANEVAAVRQECVALATKRGVDIADIFGKMAKVRAPIAAKFQDPKTGKTWSGRGKSPKWLRGDRAKYEINTVQAQPLKSATAHTLKGPQAKYQDPASGKTWSGMGRVPFWIAGKDRTKFMAR